jgi:hypothetical protein
MSIPYWGSRVALLEVIAMARADRIHLAPFLGFSRAPLLVSGVKQLILS